MNDIIMINSSLNRVLYIQSITGISTINMFSCDHCEYQVASKAMLKIHDSKLHDKDSKYRCDVCGKQLSSRKS